MEKNKRTWLTACTAFWIFAESCLAAPQPAAEQARTLVETPATLFDTGSNNEPTDITADSLTLRSKERKFVYTGNVIVIKGEMKLTAQELEGTYDDKNQIRDLVAKDDVVITKGPKVRANSNRAVYQRSSETLVLSESPELEQEGSILTADRIIIYLKEDRSTAEGKVHVKLKNAAVTKAP